MGLPPAPCKITGWVGHYVPKARMVGQQPVPQTTPCPTHHPARSRQSPLRIQGNEPPPVPHLPLHMVQNIVIRQDKSPICTIAASPPRPPLLVQYIPLSAHQFVPSRARTSNGSWWAGEMLHYCSKCRDFRIIGRQGRVGLQHPPPILVQELASRRCDRFAGRCNCRIFANA